MSAQNLGSLFVVLDGKTTDFVRGFESAVKVVEKVAKEIKKLSNEVAGVSGALLAVGGAAFAMAATVDAKAATALKHFKESMTLVAIQVADLLMPALRELTALFRQVANFIAGLDPETKKAVASFAVLAAKVSVAAKVLATVASLIDGVAGALGALAGAIAAVGLGPLAAIVAGLALVAVAVAVLHKAWRENWLGIQQATATVIQWLADAWNGVVGWISDRFSELIDNLTTVVQFGLRAVASLADATNQPIVAQGARMAADVVGSLAKDLKSGAMAKKFVGAAFELGKAAATSLVDEFKRIAQELGLTEMFDKLVSKFQSAGKGAGMARGPLKDGPALADGDWYQKFTEALERTGKGAGRGRLGGATAVGGDDARRNFEAMAAEAQRVSAEARQATMSTLGQVGQAFIGKMGEVGNIANTVIAAGQQGGPWAALVAGILELFSRTKSFGTLIQTLSEGLNGVIRAIEPIAEVLFSAVSKVLAPVLKIVANALVAIAPLFGFVAEVLEAITPILHVFVSIIKGLGPVFSFVSQALSSALKSLEPVLDLVLYVLIGVGIGLSWFIRELGNLWNTTVDAITNGFRNYLNALMAGFPPAMREQMAKISEQIVNSFTLQKIDTTAANDALTELLAMGADLQAFKARAKADTKLAESAENASDKLEEFAESFLNVPSGYKVSAARFAAASDSGMGYGSDGSVTIIVNGGVTVGASDPHSFVQGLQASAETREFMRRGAKGYYAGQGDRR